MPTTQLCVCCYHRNTANILLLCTGTFNVFNVFKQFNGFNAEFLFLSILIKTFYNKHKHWIHLNILLKIVRSRINFNCIELSCELSNFNISILEYIHMQPQYWNSQHFCVEIIAFETRNIHIQHPTSNIQHPTSNIHIQHPHPTWTVHPKKLNILIFTLTKFWLNKLLM